MVLYLASSCIALQRPDLHEKMRPLDDFGFFSDLKSEWPDTARLLYIPCNPDDEKNNEYRLSMLLECFKRQGLVVEKARILTDVSADSLTEMIKESNVIYMAGGHAPTQLAFMKRLGLKEALLGYPGIIIAVGAGAINSAYTVYLAPELEGEAKDPNYVKFSDGLDLTNIQLIPHSESTKKKKIDGLDFINDVAIPDSYGRRFYLISDGSFFKVKNGKTSFTGLGEIIEDGVISPLKQGNIVPYMGDFELPVIKSILVDGYDMVITVNMTNEVCEVYYLNEILWDVFENSKLRYKDICFKLSQSIVEEERDAFLDQMRLSVVYNELQTRGNYVRTVHAETPKGRRAKNIRVRGVPGYPDWLLVVFFDITTSLDHDVLTDEYARAGFMERARVFLSELPQDEHYSLVYTNVQGFKAVNELFGDLSGDQVIFQTRDVLRERLQPLIMGRLESDHFVLITEDKNLTEKNLKSICRQVFRIESKEYNYEVRCGIYSITNKNLEITQILAGAKLAEKSIKPGKKSLLYAYYDDNMKENYIKQRFLLSDMMRGIADKEFEPYYQPIVDAKTGEIVSAEMLIRWRHRDLGMVAPKDFVPVIESDGKISILDDIMISRGIDLVTRRIAQGKKAVPCAVNLSRVDFYDSAFIDSVQERIKKLKSDSTMIRFEVTESAYADLEARAVDFLNKMKKQGIKILLDDYGSGMSSMSMLETFVFDIIKLDQGFIKKIGINDRVEAIITSTINLSHSIGAKVTAEGVETEKQLQFLQAVGCDYIQGYYFYRPMKEKDFEKILDQ